MTDILDDDYLASEESALEQFKLDQWGRQHETRVSNAALALFYPFQRR
jgi:hypothetical protein